MELTLFRAGGRIPPGFALSGAVRAALTDYAVRHGCGLPSLSVDAAGRPLTGLAGVGMSVAHSGAFALLALCRGAVGVDLELPRTLDHNAIARRFFTPEEQEYVRLRGADGFLELWTRKEALYKWRGGTVGRPELRGGLLPALAGADGKLLGAVDGAYLYNGRRDGLFWAAAAGDDVAMPDVWRVAAL